MASRDSKAKPLGEQAQYVRAGETSQLLEQHRARLKQMVKLRMDPRVQARVDPSDVVQEAFITASQQWREYLQTQPIPVYPWLRRIAWQTLLHVHERHLDAARRSVRREQRGPWRANDESTMQVVKLLTAGTSTPSASMEKKERQQRVRQALEQMRYGDREVLLQRYAEQLSLKEIAAVLGINEAAAYKRHARALERLREILEESP